jgi:hypothetical protein
MSHSESTTLQERRFDGFSFFHFRVREFLTFLLRGSLFFGLFVFASNKKKSKTFWFSPSLLSLCNNEIMEIELFLADLADQLREVRTNDKLAISLVTEVIFFFFFFFCFCFFPSLRL